MSSRSDHGTPDRETPAFRAVDLSVGYRSRKSEKVVLRDVCLSLRRGEMACLMGPNGIGKSSLLRTIAKIQSPLSGSVELDGVDIQELGSLELARKLGAVLTERVDVGALPAYRIVELGRYPYLNWAGTLGNRDHEIVQWAMSAVGIEHLATQDSNKMSDGEKQRVMIARALAQEPVMLLLDEPTAFLDVASRVELMGLLRRLARKERLAILLSTHDLELALRTADTIWLVGPGGRFLTGAPEDIIMGGHLAKVFESGSVRFQPEDRAFRLLTECSGAAKLEGRGLAAALAAAVLEREGFAITTNGDALFSLSVDESSRWQAAFHDKQKRHGDTFAELAEFIREFSGEPGE